MSRIFRLSCSVLAGLCLAPALAWAVSYTITQLDFPTTGLFATRATGLNTAGQVVGDAVLTDGEVRGFAYEAGTYQQIFAAFGVPQEIDDINAAGQIVGRYGDGAFLLTVPFSSFPFATPRVMTPAFQFPLPTQAALAKISPDLGFRSSIGLRINTAGLLYGRGDFSDPSGTHEGDQQFVYDPVTDALEFVSAQPPEFDLLPYSPFSIPGARDITVRDVAENGAIAGSFLDATGMHGFLGTPVPEPMTLALLGLPILVLWRKWQQ